MSGHLNPIPYRSVADADFYFSNQLYATDWTGASKADKEKALAMATRAVDSLKFRGVKTAVWDAMVVDGTVDTTLTVEQNIANSELTEAEVKAAYDSQAHQWPRNDASESEIWHLQLNANGGHYALVFNGEQTADILYNATMATVLAALEALGGVTAGDFTIALDPDDPNAADGSGPYHITHGVPNYNTLEAVDVDLTGGGNLPIEFYVVNDNVPNDIFWAVCEEAKSLLSGRDAEQEFRNLELNSDGVGSNRVTMDRSGMPPRHTAHLITSPLAWKFLQRYLAPNNSFTIKRT